MFPFLGASRLQTVRFSSSASDLQLPTRLPILTSAASQHFVYLMTGLTTKTLTESSPLLPSPTHPPQHQQPVFLERGPVTALLKASQWLPQIFALNIQGPKVLFLWHQPTSQKPVTMDTFTSSGILNPSPSSLGLQEMYPLRAFPPSHFISSSSVRVHLKCHPVFCSQPGLTSPCLMGHIPHLPYSSYLI